MAETLTPTLRPASQNPWYKLATAREDHAANRDLWNGYMRHLIREGEADNLRRADARAIVLPTLRPDEIEQIREDIPGLPQALPEEISLSGLNFAEPVNFRDFYFPVFATFRGSNFAGNATFRGSNFAGNATFRGSSFAGNATFRGSSFAGEANFEASTFAEYADFESSTFAKYADFEKSTFTGEANFMRSTFAEYADFEASRFKKTATFEASRFRRNAGFEASRFTEHADFEKSTFAGYANFEKSTFADNADFSNATYEGKTSFQNVTFTRAPLFFATTLHEDTDWTDVDWPDKPADKEEATQYVRRYDRLALIMSTLKQPDNEHRFFRLSMQAKEVRDGEGISTRLSRLYGLFFCYGWGLKRALGLWVLHIFLGAGCLSVVPPCTMSYPLSGLTALAISFSNSLPFLGLQRGPAKNAYASFDTLTGFNILGGIQSVIGPILLFFLLLTIRNRFRLR